jgi:broad specificity phosphatase PhoE
MTTLALPDVAATRIVLVRHGEPEESIQGRCYGRLDVGLSARGREQVRRTQHLLADVAFTTVYSSPRRRARESAGLLAAGRAGVTVDERLREIDFGIFEGLTYDEIAKTIGIPLSSEIEK